MKKKINNILVVGQSKIFIEHVKYFYIYDNLEICPWRSIKKNFLKINKIFDLILVCGYDYSSYNCNYQIFLNKNIYFPLKFILKNSNQLTEIIYIDTLDNNNKHTFSRYLYSKKKLAFLLSKRRINFYGIKLPTILTQTKLTSSNVDFLSKFFFTMLLRLGKLENIDSKMVSKKIYNKNFFKNCLYKNIKGIYLNYKRNILIDRTIRFFFG